MLRPLGLALALLLVAGSLPARAQNFGVNNDPNLIRMRYMVEDIPAAVAFYRDKLGFKVEAQSGNFFAALSRGNVQLLLSPTKGPGGASQPMPDGRKPVPGGWNRIVIYLPNLEAEVARLRKEGVHFRNDIVKGLGGNEILLDDPSGNPIELFQPG
jgi:catechol 2,3-dioxygenase-like lactoylglutathione lyase family enzyme